MSASSRDSLRRYELIGRIARGGMAEVFRARAYGVHGFRKDVAIKRILPELARTAEFERRFISEAKVATELAHANIVQVLDFGRDETSLFIAMEFVDGTDLAKLLAAYRGRGDHLPLAVVMNIAIGMCNGLDLAHTRGVLHRDVSPSNVLVSRTGEVKVADFGIAKIENASRTTRRKIMGKWSYMSPEQARGETLDARSDVFATGVVLYELLTSSRLLRAKNLEQALDQLLEAEFPPPSSLRPDVPPVIDVITKKALERDPAERYQSSADMSRALTEACYALGLVHTQQDVAEVVMANVAPTPRADTDATDAETDATAADPNTTDAGPTANLRSPSAEGDDSAATTRTIVRRGVQETGLSLWTIDPAAQPGADRRSPWLWIGLGIAALAAGVLTAVLIAGGLRGDSQQQAVATDAARLAAAAPDAMATAPGPRASADAMAAVPVPDAATAPPDAGAATVELRVTSKPKGAKVYLDGKSIGVTPLTTAVPSDGASHRVRLEKRGFQDYSRRITLGDTAVVVRRTLVPDSGTVSIQVDPWAHVYHRGKKLGTTPLRNVRLPAGRQRLRLVNPATNQSKTVTVTVPRARPYVFSF